METFDLIQQKIQDLSNEVDLLYQTINTSFPNLDEDETLSSLVTSLQEEVNNFKTNILSFQSSLNSLNNTCADIVVNVEEISTQIENLKNVDLNTQTQIDNLVIKHNDLVTVLNTVNTQVSSNTNNINNLNGDIDDIVVDINDLQYTTSNHSSQISALEYKNEDINLELTDLRNNFNQYVASDVTVDNELYFIVNGTYVTSEVIDQLVDGSYTI